MNDVYEDNYGFPDIGLITARLLQGLTVIADEGCVVVDFESAKLRLRGQTYFAAGNGHADGSRPSSALYMSDAPTKLIAPPTNIATRL